VGILQSKFSFSAGLEEGEYLEGLGGGAQENPERWIAQGGQRGPVLADHRRVRPVSGFGVAPPPDLGEDRRGFHRWPLVSEWELGSNSRRGTFLAVAPASPQLDSTPGSTVKRPHSRRVCKTRFAGRITSVRGGLRVAD